MDKHQHETRHGGPVALVKVILFCPPTTSEVVWSSGMMFPLGIVFLNWERSGVRLPVRPLFFPFLSPRVRLHDARSTRRLAYLSVGSRHRVS